MEHTEVIASNATDRYLLGELNAAEADAFEEHFFDCAACADEVRSGMSFIDGGRKLVLEAEQPAAAKVVPIASRRRAPTWIPAAVAAMLILAVGIPFMQSRTDAPTMDIGHTRILDVSEVRGEPAEPIRVGKDEPVLIAFDIPPTPSYSRYEVRVVDPNGKVVNTKPITKEDAKDMLTLWFRERGAGTYELVIVGIEPAGQRAEIANTPFIIKRPGSTS